MIVLKSGIAAAAALLLVGCTPPYVDKAYLPLAKEYYRACERGACPAEGLTLDQLYAVHLYGRAFHPWRGAAGAFARRGAEAIPFLHAKLAAARDGGEISSLFDILRAMGESKSFDVRSDPALVAAVQDAAHRVDDPGFWLRDTADEIETGEAKPFFPGASRKWNEGYGKDYDVAFAKAHCRGCDYRDWKAAAEALPVDKLYALQRYGWEHFDPSRILDRQLAARGAAAIPLLKAKLAQADRGLMLFNITSVLEMMQASGRYDPAADPELLALADAALLRVKGAFTDWSRESIARMKNRTPRPQVEILAAPSAPAPAG